MSLSFLGFGSPMVDYNAVVTEDFIRLQLSGTKGGTEHIDSRERKRLLAALGKNTLRTCAGSAGNTVSALLHLGDSAALFGKLAEDADGQFFLREMEKDGGECRYLLRAGQGTTACCICCVTPDAERTMRSDLGVSRDISPEDLPENVFAGRPCFHMEGYMMELPCFFPLLCEAKKKGCRISLDLSSKELAAAYRTELPEMIRNYVNVLFMNREEAEALTGIAGEEKIMEHLKNECPVIHLKSGEKGVWLKNSAGTIEHIPARQVPARDTTAAGDYYTAGYFHGIFRGKKETDAARDAVFLASEIVQFPGSRLPEERWEKIRQQLQQGE